YSGFLLADLEKRYVLVGMSYLLDTNSLLGCRILAGPILGAKILLVNGRPGSTRSRKSGGLVGLSAIMRLAPNRGLKQHPELSFSKIGDRAEDDESHCKFSLQPRCGQEGLVCRDEKQVGQAGREDANPGGVKEPKWD